MRKITTILFQLLIVVDLMAQFSPGQNKPISIIASSPAAQPKWKVKPFENKAFIENHGQFDDVSAKKGEKILYAAILGNVNLYFTKKGIIYRKQDAIKRKKESEKNGTESEQHYLKIKDHYIEAEWSGADPSVSIIPAEKKNDYFTYSSDLHSTIKAELYKKITYKNLYPGIDALYEFPEGKEGIKYSLIVHPGADISAIKLKYNGVDRMNRNEQGDIVISSEVDILTDHAPVSFQENDNNPVSTICTVSHNQETFTINGNYDHSKTIVIDPWQTNPSFSGSDYAYDLDYDNKGNVFVYGGPNWYYQLVKFNSAGVIQWTYTTSGQISGCYGDCCVDDNGNAYVTGGPDWNNDVIIKVNPAGNVVTSFSFTTGVNQYPEIWRLEYNPCYHSIVVGLGAYASLGLLDTNMITSSALNGFSFQDAVLMTLDPSMKNYYVAFHGLPSGPLKKLPMTSFVPAYNVSSGYAFAELGMDYIAPPSWGTNSMNGMAASFKWLYLYDGSTLTRFNKNTGASVSNIVVSTPVYAVNSFSYGVPYNCIQVYWGGLAVDACDNLYVGNNKDIFIYDSTYTLTSTIPLTDIVFDVVLGKNYKTLYACGQNFVAAFDNPSAPQPVITKLKTAASCTCNGTAQATLTMCNKIDTTALSFSWSNGQSTKKATGLCAGTYTVTISISCGEQEYTDTVNIFSASGITASVSSQNNPLCNGGSSGTATMAGGSGASPYSYSWSNSQTTATATGLAAGTYTCTVTDNGGCTTIQTVTLGQPAAISTPTFTVTNASCGNSNGSAVASASAGTGSLTYSWSTFATGITASNLNAGTYVVTVTDANGCTISQSVGLSNSPAPTINSTVKVDVLCKSSLTGSAVVSATGTGTLTYTWNTGATGQTLNNVAAGSYVITVEDGTGCKNIGFITITEPSSAVLISSVTPTNASCGSANGSAVAAASGGSGSLTYSWSTGSTGITASGLSAGPIYTLTVSDANTCSQTTTVSVTNNAGPILTTSVSSAIVCNGGNGSVTATAVGGSAPYTYSWSSGATLVTTSLSSQLSSVTSNTYTVTITDANSCNSVSTVTITQPSAIAINPITTMNASCGSNNGSASASASGGTGVLTYTWSSGASGQTSTNLTIGTYILTVTDANNCSSTQTASIINTGGGTLSVLQSSPILCNGGTGSVTATATSSSSPYTYSWSSGAASSTSLSANTTATGLTANIYTVTVTDANGCVATSTVNLTEPSLITIGVQSVSNASCGGSDGSAKVLAIGGTGALSYSWSSGSIFPTASGLSANTYTVTVKDANSCSQTGTVNVNNNNGPVISSITSTNPLCSTGTGTAMVNASGGTGSLTYNWSNGSTASTTNNLSGTTYTVTITDANSCSSVSTVTITQPSAITINPITTINASCGSSNGSASASASGGTGVLTYSWSSTATGQTSLNLTIGTYILTVTDANNCSSTQTASIINTGGGTLSVLQSSPILCNGSTGSVTATATSSSSPYTYSWSSGAASSTSLSANTTATGLTANIYTVTVTDANGCVATSTVNLTEPSLITIGVQSVSNASCGASDGSAKITAIGGTGALSYSWSSGSTFPTASGLSANTYTVTVKDANSCSQTVAVNVSNSNGPVISSITATSPLCSTGTGTALVNASGGTGSLTYNWSNGSTASTTNNLSGTTYTVTITDANSCSAITTVSVTVPSAVNLTATQSSPAVCGNNIGMAITTVTGGTGAYTYSWSNGVTAATASGLAANNYTVTVTDANACTSTSIVTIGSTGGPTINTITGTNPLCSSGTGTATAAATGGTGSLAYNWSNGDLTSISSGLTAGIYFVTVSDANSCTTVSTVTIVVPPAITVLTAQSSPATCGNNNGVAVATASGGSGTLTYSWSNGSTGITDSSLTANTYTVTITDANGCTQISSVTLTQATPITCTSAAVAEVCGQGNGAATVSVTGGTPNYTYSWSNGASTVSSSLSNTITSLHTSTYIVTITDSNGCSKSVSILVDSVGAGTINVTPAAETIVEGNTVAITVSGGTTYTWTPANSLTCDNCSNPVAAPVTSTTYTITATDLNGCLITAQLSITVKPACVGDDKDLFIANIFSPNNDGKNDVLFLEGNGLTNIYWAIYDRWGNLVFETYDQSKGWDGTLKGNAVEPGTYVYYLKATCIKTNAEVRLKGNVSIVR